MQISTVSEQTNMISANYPKRKMTKKEIATFSIQRIMHYAFNSKCICMVVDSPLASVVTSVKWAF